MILSTTKSEFKKYTMEDDQKEQVKFYRQNEKKEDDIKILTLRI